MPVTKLTSEKGTPVQYSQPSYVSRPSCQPFDRACPELDEGLRRNSGWYPVFSSWIPGLALLVRNDGACGLRHSRESGNPGGMMQGGHFVSEQRSADRMLRSWQDWQPQRRLLRRTPKRQQFLSLLSLSLNLELGTRNFLGTATPVALHE